NRLWRNAGRRRRPETGRGWLGTLAPCPQDFGRKDYGRHLRTLLDVDRHLLRVLRQLVGRLGAGGVDKILDQNQRLQNQSDLGPGDGRWAYGDRDLAAEGDDRTDHRPDPGPEAEGEDGRGDADRRQQDGDRRRQ